MIPEDMKNANEHDFPTYPRQFKAYRWYKPLLVGLLYFVFYLLLASLIYLITRLVFHTTVTGTGYDSLDLYSAAGAFFNCSVEAAYIPAFLLAALIVKDRPFSSYLSSMGGWRWKTFAKTLAAGFVIFGIPTIIRFLLNGRAADVRLTAGGLFFLILLMPLLCVAEELLYRSYITQTFSSWFRLPIVGLIAQTIAFAAVHPYNRIGVISIAVSAVIYGLTVSSVLLNAAFKILFLVFIIYADKKLHWFDEVQHDDVEPFNAKHARK